MVEALTRKTGEYGDEYIQGFYSRQDVQANSFSLSKVTAERVAEMLGELNTAKATGLDNISAKFLRDGAQVIAPCVAHLINLSLEQGIVPSCTKHAKIIPLFKKGSRSHYGNYRPVSILSITSKILERVVHEQISEYVDRENLLYEFQSGFRKYYSTDSCLLYMYDFIRKEMDEGKLCGMVLLDLQKAFDTVDLINKLKAIGMNGTATEWVTSYLTDREQKVEVNGFMSDTKPVVCGVPQGSVLGPLLFLLYINDMRDVCSCNLYLFADDAALLISHKDKNTLQSRLGEELTKISSWLCDNRLSLHLGKTESILFGSKPRLKKAQVLRVEVGSG